MNVTLVISLCAIALTIGILVVMAYIVMILSYFKKMLAPIDKMLSEISNEFKPLLHDVAGITTSVNNFLARVDRITRVVFGKVEMVAMASEKVSSYAQKIVKNPKIELENLISGIKNLFRTVFKRKKEGE